MADAPIVHIGENSPEQVAYKLFEIIARVEQRTLYPDRDNPSKTADRKWVLDTYAECFQAVRQPWGRE